MDAQDSGFKELSEKQVEEIAERAAEKAVAKITDEVYRQVGKSIIQKLTWTIGAVTVGAVLYFGKIKGGV